MKSPYPRGSARYVAESKRLFEEASEAYRKDYFSEGTGGFVLIHRGHRTSASELFVFRDWARQGRRCILLDERGTEKSADAEVDGERWEHKEITEVSTNPICSMQEHLYNGKKQAPRVVVHVSRSSVELEDLNRGTRFALYHDDREKLLVMAVVSPEGRTQIITREEWADGKRFRASEGNN